VLARHGFADAIVCIFIPPLATRSSDVADAIREAVEAFELSIPVLTVFMSTEGTPGALKSDSTRAGIPAYAFPEDAASALARAADYGVWRESPEGEVPHFADARPEEAAAVIASALGRGEGWLEPGEVESLLRCYGLPVIESRTVGSPVEAGRAAEDLGVPVAIKVIAPGVVHKTDMGAVEVGLSEPARAQAAAERIAARVREAGQEPTGFLVQRMAPPGVELLLGVAHDPLFGPVIACGAGGVTAEVMKDVAVRITPLTNIDARAMLRSLRTYRLLEGFRGAPPVDIGAVESLLLRLSAMVEAHPEVAEMDCNPVIVGPNAAVVVDARVRVESAEPPRPTPAV
jgi:acyl-CoA synthetase (NDP forming)